MSVFNHLKFPAETVVNKEIPLEMFFQHPSFSESNEKIIGLNVERIIIRYSIKEDNSKKQKDIIDSNVYDELQILEVFLKTRFLGKFEILNIVRLISKCIPYPTVAILTYENCQRIFISKFHTGKQNKSSNVIDEVIYSEWINFNKIYMIDRGLFSDLNYYYKSSKTISQIYSKWILALKSHTDFENRHNDREFIIDDVTTFEKNIIKINDEYDYIDETYKQFGAGRNATKIFWPWDSSDKQS